MDTKDLELFSSIFELFPSLSIVHINNNMPMIQAFLQDLASSSSGHCLDVNLDDVLINLKFKQRDFDYAVLSNCFYDTSKYQSIIKSLYSYLKNSARLVYIVPKEDEYLVEYTILENIGFTNISRLDIFSSYIIIIAQKNRMWV